MKIRLLILFFFLLSGCGGPKTVMICGDHVCINKAEAKQFFEENLTIEVRIIDNKIEKQIDLVELNLKNDNEGKREISVASKEVTDKKLKTLSDEEISSIKKDIKTKKKNNKIVKKIINKKDNSDKRKKINTASNLSKIETNNTNNKSLIMDDAARKGIDVVDVCTLIKKCSIDEISKYLLEEGKKKDFPEISIRQ